MLDVGYLAKKSLDWKEKADYPIGQSDLEATPEGWGGSKPDEEWEKSQDTGISQDELSLPAASRVASLSVLGSWPRFWHQMTRGRGRFIGKPERDLSVVSRREKLLSYSLGEF